MSEHVFNGPYSGEALKLISFPLGGIGAGMIGFEGAGGFTDASLRHTPDLFRKTAMFAAVAVKGRPETARVLEGPAPSWRVFGPSPERDLGNGATGKNYGLPRFRNAEFNARFPFARVSLDDPKMPLRAQITAWTPFIPNDADNSSLPVTAVEYTLTNSSDDSLEAVFSFHSENIMRVQGSERRGVDRAAGGFRLWQDGSQDKPWDQGEMIAAVDGEAFVDCRWFRGWGFDTATMLWEDIRNCEIRQRPPVTQGEESPGGSVYVPFALKSGESRTIRVRLSWFVPFSNLQVGHKDDEDACACGCCGGAGGEKPSFNKYGPWYSTRFGNASEVDAYWRGNVNELRERTVEFSDTLFDSTLPDEAIEAVTANLSIMLSPTVLRLANGDLWGWEGWQ